MDGHLSEVRHRRANQRDLSTEEGRVASAVVASSPVTTAPLADVQADVVTGVTAGKRNPQAATTVDAGLTNFQPPSPIIDPQQSEARCCRICFDGEETLESGRLFSPCRCLGSMRFVHVSCLNDWRAASANENSYYKCDACHYEYRLQRLRIAKTLLSPRMQIAFSALIFVTSALVFGSFTERLFPALVPLLLDRLLVPMWVHALFNGASGPGNPACWHGGFTFKLCCVGPAGGNQACWDSRHSFEACCVAFTSTWDGLRLASATVLRVLVGGVAVLSVVGFALYLWRQVKEAWNTVGGNWQLALLGMWLYSFDVPALCRMIAIVGTTFALRELFVVLSFRAKLIASMVGDRVLEVV
eukprot:TRINITY_DN61526_c0_g1_i1.p1 TRINITY_DN61526_c0_g1~~TRINITY_DN61526_c0_g1_i1.p1  ORF type:complete len:357 (-),score=64.44 TRINITY_DN61526_c0_g1_i1:531-1601(-)